MLKISQLFIYPVKSLGGMEVSSATLTDRGFENDRRWMLVDTNNQFITQREYPQLAMLQVSLEQNGLLVRHKINDSQIQIPFDTTTGETTNAVIWEDTCNVLLVNPVLDQWFSDILGIECRLVYMPDNSVRKVDEKFATRGEITSFSDGYPLLIISQASLDDLNSRLETPVPINRFRPNMVFTGGQPFEEDQLEHFRVNGIDFFGIKPCARCSITTINQENGSQAKEPLKTLAAYRMKNNKVYFGQNLLFQGKGTIQVGAEIMKLSWKLP